MISTITACNNNINCRVLHDIYMQVLLLISYGVSYHVYQIQLYITYTAFGGEPIALLSAGRRFVGSSASTSIVLRPEETRFTPAALHAQTNYHIHGGRGTTPTLEKLLACC